MTPQQGFIVIYPLFVRTIYDLASPSAVRQLSMDMPVWLSIESERTAWREERSRQYDQFNHLVGITTKYIPFEALKTGTALSEPCAGITGNNEKEILTGFWRHLNEFRARPAGWRIRDQIWPRLLNRSLVQGVAVPGWAKPNLSKKWMDVDLDDLATIYSCGVYDKYRPLPRLHDALAFWLGRSFPDEDAVMLQAETSLGQPELAAASCEYVAGMSEVLCRYLREPS